LPADDVRLEKMYGGLTPHERIGMAIQLAQLNQHLEVYKLQASCSPTDSEEYDRLLDWARRFPLYIGFLGEKELRRLVELSHLMALELKKIPPKDLILLEREIIPALTWMGEVMCFLVSQLETLRVVGQQAAQLLNAESKDLYAMIGDMNLFERIEDLSAYRDLLKSIQAFTHQDYTIVVNPADVESILRQMMD
jgi:hypothetical protein